MPLVLVGTLLLIAYMADIGPVGTWPWWVIAAPFAGAVAWWSFADNSGWTQRRVMEKMERKKADRRDKAMDALGLPNPRDRKSDRHRAASRSGAKRGSASSEPPAPPAEPPRRDPRI